MATVTAFPALAGKIAALTGNLVLTHIHDLNANNSLPLFHKFGPATISQQIEALKSADPDLSHILKLQDMQNVFSTYDNLF